MRKTPLTVPLSICWREREREDGRGSNESEGGSGERETHYTVLVGLFLRPFRDEAEYLNRPPGMVHAKKPGQRRSRQ